VEEASALASRQVLWQPVLTVHMVPDMGMATARITTARVMLMAMDTIAVARATTIATAIIEPKLSPD
jgi:hypothetical protein